MDLDKLVPNILENQALFLIGSAILFDVQDPLRPSSDPARKKRHKDVLKRVSELFKRLKKWKSDVEADGKAEKNAQVRLQFYSDLACAITECELSLKYTVQSR